MHAPPGNAVVSVQGLTKRYGKVVALEELTFALEPGRITGFLGPNGAGKSTTLRILLGLAQPTSGEALVFGRRYAELEHPARRVGAVPVGPAGTICAPSRSPSGFRATGRRRCSNWSTLREPLTDG